MTTYVRVALWTEEYIKQCPTMETWLINNALRGTWRHALHGFGIDDEEVAIMFKLKFGL